MQRRGVTVVLGALLVALLAWGVSEAPVPYVVLAPGPTVDTLGESENHDVIEVTGAPTSDSEGQLRLVTVGVYPRVDMVDAIRAWFSDSEAVVPRDLIYPPDKTSEQVEQENAEQFQASQSSAETAALRELGYPVEVMISSIVADTPAAGPLQVNDQITAVDGLPVTSGGHLAELIRAKPVGSAVQINYTRAGKPATVSLNTAAGEDGRSRIGVAVEQKQPHPFELKIDLDKIGGPSAGLMFALGIIDKLKPEDLTGKIIIAGTGTIDDDGRVGAIGGIPQKLVAAKGAGAKVFLTPDTNCAEAVANAVPGLPLIKVSTLDEALAALATLRAGGQPALCPAG